MTVPVLPESAPFNPAQRAWLNGFFAGILGQEPGVAAGNGESPPLPMVTPNGNGVALPPAAEGEDGYPWHDPLLAMEERMKLAEGRPLELRLMAATAQLDCGSCGYMCRSYAEALASGADTDVTKCVPGGKETAKKFREILKETSSLSSSPPSAPPAILSSPIAPDANGTGAPAPPSPLPMAPPPSLLSTVYDRRNPYPARIL
ncbi:MAG: hypothetical protein KY468_16690, partial [Armatimonadetes bacterium]|nr:hypothetical protein [Armatimonadota bacterium]